MPTVPVTPLLIGVSGGPCSGKSHYLFSCISHDRHVGKSTVCQRIVDALQSNDNANRTTGVTVIAMENFYKPKTAEQRDMAHRGNYNLDHPDAFDDQLLFNNLSNILNGQTVQVRRPSTNQHDVS